MPDFNLKLLIADDHQLFTAGLGLILKQTLPGATIETVSNGKEAIDKCRHHDFDIVLMDIDMPVIDGIEATRQIKFSAPATKILIVSMASDMQTVAQGLKAKADGFLIKNATVDEFLTAFRTVQRDDIYLSPQFVDLMMINRLGRAVMKEEYIAFSETIITPREKSILKLIAEGFTNQEIADALVISDKTVNTHRNNMLAKLGQPNTAALVKFAIDNKLI